MDSFINLLPTLSSIAPSIVILLIFYFQDKYPEPPRMIVFSFGLGVLICFPAGYFNSLVINQLEEKFFYGELSINSYEFLYALIPGAFVEEVLKFIVLYFFCFQSKHLDEKIDALVYGTTVSLGFATLENYDYVRYSEFYNTSWSEVAWIRAFSAVPTHACFGMIMGYFLYTYRSFKLKAITLGLTVPIILHMLYNSSYLNFPIVLIISIILALTFFSKSKKLQNLRIWK